MQEENVEISMNLVVPPSLVYDACINRELLKKWMFAGPDTKVIDVTIVDEVEGLFSFVEQNITSGDRVEYTGRYLTLNPPHELQFTLSAPKRFEGETTVTVSINPTAGGCIISLSQSGPAKGLSRASWELMFEQLRMSLEIQ